MKYSNCNINGHAVKYLHDECTVNRKKFIWWYKRIIKEGVVTEPSSIIQQSQSFVNGYKNPQSKKSSIGVRRTHTNIDCILYVLTVLQRSHCGHCIT